MRINSGSMAHHYYDLETAAERDARRAREAVAEDAEGPERNAEPVAAMDLYTGDCERDLGRHGK